MALPVLVSGLGKQLVSQGAKGAAKGAMKKMIFGDKNDKKSSAIVKADQQPKQQSGVGTKKSSAIVPLTSSLGSSTSTPKATIGSSVGGNKNLLIIKEKVVKIENLLGESYKNKKKQAENQRKLSEREWRGDKEEKLEKKSKKVKGLSIPIPGKGLFDNIVSRIINFIFWTALGSIFPKLKEILPSLIQIGKVLFSIGKFIVDILGKILDVTLTVIDGAYNFIENAQAKVDELSGGEDINNPIKGFKDALTKVLSIAMIAAMLGTGGPETFDRKPDKPGKKPDRPGSKKDSKTKTKPKSDLVKWKDRDPVGEKIRKQHGKEAYRAYQNEYDNGIKKGLTKQQSTIRAKSKTESLIKKGRITSNPLKGSLAGGVKGSVVSKGGTARTTQRAATKLFGKTGGKLASKLAVKSVMRRIPIVGPLFIGMDTYLNGDSEYEESGGERGIPPGKLDYTLFKTLGAAIGGFLGTFIPIPVVGTLLGELLGEYVGDLAYRLIKGGGIKEVGRKLAKDIKGLFALGKAGFEFVKKGAKRFIDNYPRFRIPNPRIPFIGGVHEFLGNNPLSPLKFISDNQWFGNKKGKLSHLPDPSFFFRKPLDFGKHIIGSFFNFNMFKPRDWNPPAPLQDRTQRGGGGGSGSAAESRDSTTRAYIPSSGGGAGGGVYAPILDLIAKYESGSGKWESMAPGTTLPGATKMTIAEVARRATGAVGMYQNLPQYLNQRARAVGLNPNTALYNEENQRKIAVYLIEKGQANVTPQMLKDNPDEAMIRLSRVWAAIPVPKDMQGHRKRVKRGESYYAGVGNNKAHITPEMMYQAMRASVNLQNNITSTSTPQSPLTNRRVPTSPHREPGRPESPLTVRNVGSGKGKKIYLHWTAGSYSGVPRGSYHTVITGDGKAHNVVPYNQTGEHTWRRNSNSVGFSLAAMHNATPDNFGNSPVKSSQYESMAKEVAKLAKAWKWSAADINVRNVLTHAEAASNKDGWQAHDNYGPVAWGGTGERWDLAKLYQGDKFGSGGDKIRAMIKNKMEGGGLVGERTNSISRHTSYESPNSKSRVVYVPVPVSTPSISPALNRSTGGFTQFVSPYNIASKVEDLSRS